MENTTNRENLGLTHCIPNSLLKEKYVNLTVFSTPVARED
jgi:hypothetical protein